MNNNRFYQRDLITIKDLDSVDVSAILDMAHAYKNKKLNSDLNNKIIANCFFEPSTRTRLSFESAAHRSGARVIGFSNGEDLSLKKGETLCDTIRVINGYADMIVIRHPSEGSAMLAADIADIPVINAGDGANQHPTQALTDLFTIREAHGKVDGLSIALAGDLKYGRTIHSLAEICSLFDIRLYLISPESLALPETLCDWLKKRGVRFSFHHSLQEVIPNIDILYSVRIQRERADDPSIIHSKKEWALTSELLKKARPHLKILCPLPRMQELPIEIDSTPHAMYFDQAKNGVFVRQALLNMILCEAPA